MKKLMDLKMLPSEVFEEKKYVKVSKYLPNNMTNLICKYVKIQNERVKSFVEADYSFNKHLEGDITGDPLVQDSFCRYADPFMDTFLDQSKDDIEFFVGEELIPTYSYYRVYKEGMILEKHTDRPSCEISVSLCLGYDFSNLEDAKNKSWPILVNNSGKRDQEGIPIFLDVGDIIVYEGCNVEHWREPFEGAECVQLFLHYVRKTGNFSDFCKFDGRPKLGLPSYFKDNEKNEEMNKNIIDLLPP